MVATASSGDGQTLGWLLLIILAVVGVIGLFRVVVGPLVEGVAMFLSSWVVWAFGAVALVVYMIVKSAESALAKKDAIIANLQKSDVRVMVEETGKTTRAYMASTTIAYVVLIACSFALLVIVLWYMKDFADAKAANGPQNTASVVKVNATSFFDSVWLGCKVVFFYALLCSPIGAIGIYAHMMIDLKEERISHEKAWKLACDYAYVLAHGGERRVLTSSGEH
ncbi:hypothetical protein COY32_04830 [candidate division WWE3 bacterium CG_4_10_14_0_2_um_filter_41_14]|uniref:Uncharacterized protein n=1 Tax=candidate division WWE3 bacterium CG_4_10_14_0_2_um_filter_41_14 TaxID=1975072 RepID=A0A2M7THG2_UNCKA|nr:MAG: hypothetical protein COY32_04830 [candidate division WWE3 bacterium CG_4_10_14_0_2_um_filter_41_14]